MNNLKRSFMGYDLEGYGYFYNQKNPDVKIEIDKLGLYGIFRYNFLKNIKGSVSIVVEDVDFINGFIIDESDKYDLCFSSNGVVVWFENMKIDKDVECFCFCGDFDDGFMGEWYLKE